MTQQVIITLSTCPDEAVAQRIASTLVAEKSAACVTRMAAVRSTYIWNGLLQDDAEILLMMKTTSDRVTALEARLKELHPYEIPELLTVSIAGGNERYLEWVRMGASGE